MPGKGAESLLIQFLDGTRQPQMPPKTSIPRDQIAVLRRWIDQGAKVDAARPRDRPPRRGAARRPSRGRRVRLRRPAARHRRWRIRPTARRLAVAGYREVLVVDPATGRTLHRLGGFPDQVTAVAFHPDGLRLAGAGGAAGRQGEVRIWTRDGRAWRESDVLRGHDDTVLALAWRPRSDQLATASLDKLILVWDASTGKVVRTIKNHADIVDALAYSPDGKRLASGSADKTAKVYDAETGLQVAGLSSHNEAVLCGRLQPRRQAPRHRRRPTGRSGPGRSPTRRTPTRGSATPARSTPSPGGPTAPSLLAGAGGKPSFLTYKADNGQRVVNIKEDTLPQDWVYAVAAAPDNQTVAVGGWDGAVSFWSLKTGEKLRAFVPGRDGAKP